MAIVGRNDPCPCGSGKKYKSCCANKQVGPITTTSWQQMLQQGIQLRIAGRFADAIRMFNQVLTFQKDQPDALDQLGIAHAQQNKHAEAEQYLRRAIEASPNNPLFITHLGNVLSGLSQFNEAINQYQQSLKLRSNDAATWYNLGNAQSNHNQNEAAVESYRKAISFKPDYALAYLALGNVYSNLIKFNDAADVYKKAFELNPNLKEISLKLGRTLALSGKPKEAMPHMEKAYKEDPESREIPFDLAKVYDESSRLDLGIGLMNHYLTKDPKNIDALLLLSNFYLRFNQPDEATKASRKILEIDPKNYKGLSDYGSILANQGRVDEALKLFKSAMQDNLEGLDIGSLYLFFMLFHPDFTPEMIAEEHRKWYEEYSSKYSYVMNPEIENPDPDRKLRIGYVSPDFSHHVIGRNMIPVFRNHDKSKFEIFAYSSTLRKDDLTEEFKKVADHWRDVSHSTDEELTEIIQNDRLDIVVDLAMHLAGSRLKVFAQKPVAISFTFAAYPGTTGLKTIDYRLTDPYLDPPGEHDQFYSEKTVQLPNTFWCFQETSDELPVNELPAAKNGHITFGCLNNFFKINPFTLELWSKVLLTVPASKLMLLTSPGNHWDETLKYFESKGIAADRIVRASRNKRSVYLAHYHSVDIGLDSYPYNGHSTSLDSYYMGVPVVTYTGRPIVSRAGFSQLSNLELTELVAYNEDDFVKIASALATDIDRLKQLRATLRDRMKQSPLMDTVKFTRGIEDAYRTAWKSAVASRR